MLSESFQLSPIRIAFASHSKVIRNSVAPRATLSRVSFMSLSRGLSSLFDQTWDLNCLQLSATTTPTATCPWASRATVTGSVRVATRGCNGARPCWCSTGGPWGVWYHRPRIATCRRRRCPPRATYRMAATSRTPKRRICRPACRHCRPARCRSPWDRELGTRVSIMGFAGDWKDRRKRQRSEIAEIRLIVGREFSRGRLAEIPRENPVINSLVE